MLFRPVDPVLQLARLTGETVKVVAHNRVEETRLVVLDHTLIGRALLRPIGRGYGLINICLDDLPTAILGEVLAILALTVNSESVHLAIERDAQVYHGAHRGTGG